MSIPSRIYRIAAIPADGVGIEVVAAGRTVLDALAAASDGSIRLRLDRVPLGVRLLRAHRPHDGRRRPGGAAGLRRHLFRRRRLARPSPTTSACGACGCNIAQNFDQWAKSARCISTRVSRQPLRKADDTHLDWVVVRENSEGEYAGLGGRNLSGRGPGNEVALQTALFTEKGCERIIRFAFDLARTRPVKKVSSVTKSNAQQYGMVLWDETFARVAADYPDVDNRERARRRHGREVRAQARGPVGRRRLQPQCSDSCPTCGSAAGLPTRSGGAGECSNQGRRDVCRIDRANRSLLRHGQLGRVQIDTEATRAISRHVDVEAASDVRR